MRYYLGVHKFAPIAGMVGDFGWMSPRFIRYKCILNYWNQMLSMDDMRLTKHVFKYDYQNSNVNKNWCSDVNQISKLLNMDHVFNNGLIVRGLNLQKHHDCSHRSTSTNCGPGLDMTMIYQFLEGAKIGSLCGNHFGQIQDGRHPE